MRTWERQSVRAAADRLLHAVRAGRGGTLFLVGGPGLGKTSLLREALASAQAVPGTLAGAGCGDVMERTVPFGVFGQALRAVGGPAPGVTPEGDGLTGREHFYRVLRWLDDLDRPLLIALDDLHWADADSLALLSFISRRVQGLPVGLIGTMRPWPDSAREIAAALAGDGIARVERLDALTREAAGELLSARLGRRVPTSVSARAWERCAGNPMLLEQVALAVERGDIDIEAEDWSGLGRGGLLLTRFAGLSPAALRCARAASVLGGHLRLDLAAEIAGLADAEVDAALDALYRTGLVAAEPSGRVRFTHELFAYALYHDLPAPLRARLHARCFRVLSRHGLHAEASEHALRTGLPSDPEPPRVVERAGRAVPVGGAPATGAAQPGAAVRMADAHAGTRLLFTHGEALLRAGEAGAAARVYAQALARAGDQPGVRADALRRLGRAHHLAGDAGTATERFREAADLLSASDPGRAADVLLDHALALRVAGGPAACLPLVDRARRLAAAGPEAVRGRAEAVHGFFALLGGDPTGFEAVSAVPASGRVGSDPGAEPADLDWTWGPTGICGLAHTYLERFGTASRAFRRLRSAAERIGASEALAMSLTGEADVAARTGRLAEALSLVERAAASTSVPPAGAAYVMVVRALVLQQLDRVREAEETCQQLASVLEGRDGGIAGIWLLHLRAMGHLAAGRPGQASDLYLHAEALYRRMGIGEPCVVPWAADAVAAHAAANRAGAVQRVVEWLEASAGRLPCRWPRIAAALGRAVLAETAGDDAQAALHHREALALHDEVDLPLERASALIAYGGFLCRTRQKPAARAALADALALAERIGARRLVRQSRAALLRAGGRRGRRDGAHGLTPQEQRVARLARGGSSRREIARKLFLSEGTVRTHLEHIYAKLGIHSMRELMALELDVSTKELRQAE